MAYGMEVYNASGTKMISHTDRLIRFVATGTVTANSSGYADVTVTGMANNDTWEVTLGDIPFVFDYSTKPNVYFAKQTNNLRIYANSGNTVDYYVFRT
jgi:hypothetical protein|tara:strand:+ start:342 stop:635 length:294 start_codon:yes stop_codon:yes gene_type:complete